MAITYQGMSEYDIAKSYFEKSINLTLSKDLYYARSVNIAYLYVITGDPKTAIKYYEQALNMAKAHRKRLENKR